MLLSSVLLPLFLGLIASTPLPQHGPITPRQAPPSDAVLRSETDRLMFSTPIGTFQEALRTRTPPYLYWPSESANACTLSFDHPWGFNFKKSCQRHDFGYKNYRDQKRFCPAERQKLDQQFERDLNEYCSKKSWLKRRLCYSTANGYVKGVKANRPTYSAGCPKTR